MVVRPLSAAMRSDSSRTLAAVSGSRAAECSSRSRSFGFLREAIRSVSASFSRIYMVGAVPSVGS